MPGKETESTSNNQPAANKASKQKADPDFAEDMGDINPEYRPEAEKANRKMWNPISWQMIMSRRPLMPAIG